MIVNKTSNSNKKITDATIISKDLCLDKIAYGNEGKIVGDAPFSYQPKIVSDIILPYSEEWKFIGFSKGIYIAVSDTKAIYSHNGIIWEEGSGYAATYARTFCCANGIFIVSDDTSGIYVSIDGKIWTFINMTEYIYRFLITYVDAVIYDKSKNMFYAFVNGGAGEVVWDNIEVDAAVLTSMDGINWELLYSDYQNILPTGSGWSSMGTLGASFDGEKLILITEDYGCCDINYNILGNIGFPCNRVSCHEGIGIALNTYFNNPQLIYYSTDNYQTWIETDIFNDYIVSNITYENGKFIATFKNSSTFAYSTDVINWTFVTISTGTIGAITHDGDKFILISGNSNFIMFSSDLINWTKNIVLHNYKLEEPNKGVIITAKDCQERHMILKSYNSGFIPNNLPKGESYMPAEFYNISTNGKVYVTSSYTTGYHPDDLNATGARDIVIPRAESFICISTDGVSWKIIKHVLGTEGGWSGASPDYIPYNCYINGKFYLLGEASGITAVSEDGYNWSFDSEECGEYLLPSSSGYPAYYGTFSENKEGLKIYVGSYEIKYCTDFNNWQEAYIKDNVKPAGDRPIIIYKNNIFIAYSYYNSKFNILTSYDGMNWEETFLLENQQIEKYQIGYLNNEFILKLDNTYYKSSNGKNWVLSSVTEDEWLISIIDENGKYVDLNGAYYYENKIKFKDEASVYLTGKEIVQNDYSEYPNNTILIQK